MSFADDQSGGHPIALLVVAGSLSTLLLVGIGVALLGVGVAPVGDPAWWLPSQGLDRCGCEGNNKDAWLNSQSAFRSVGLPGGSSWRLS